MELTALLQVERHLGASSRLIEEVGLLPGDVAGAPLDGCRAVVVPRAEALAAEEVLRPRARLRELLEAAAVTAPHRVRLGDVRLAAGPLPRATTGELSPTALAAPAARERAPTPAAARLLARLPAVLGLPGPFAAEQRLEEDLALDSLDLAQLRALLEDEFGARVPDAEVWRVQTIGDLLDRVAAVEAAPVAERSHRWTDRLRQPAAVPLERRFTFPRRGLRHLAAELGMLVLALLARLYFRLELVHAERLPREGPFLLCPTHQSLLDSPLIYAAFPRPLVHRTVFLAFGPYFRAGPLSWLVRPGRLILTGEGGTVVDSLRLGFDALRRGLVTCIFPEGNCSPTGAISAARPGVGLLACEAQVPLVPVLFLGTGGACSPRQPRLRRTKVRVVVGHPIPPPPPGEHGRVEWQAVADRWREAALRLTAEEAPDLLLS